MKKLLSLVLGLCFGTLAGLGASSQTVPQYQLVSSNATVTFVTNINGLILDLSAATGGATNGIQQLNGFGTNTTFNGATVHNGAHVDTNFVGELQVTNNATILGTNFPVNIAAGRGNHFGPPTNAIAAQIYDVGVLTGTNYVYAYTEWDIYGNSTTLSALSPVYAVTNKSLWLQVPLPRAGTTYRNVYRTKASDTNFFLLCQFGGSWDHFQTIFVDNVADGSLGSIAPTTDTTIFENLVTKDGVKYMMTHPTNTGPADLTMLTADPLTGTYSIDSYGEILSRSVNRPVGAGSTPAFGAIVAGTGMGYRQYWVSETNDLGVIQPFEVYQIQGSGKVVGVGPFSIAVPSIQDSTMNFGETTNLTMLGKHAIVRATSSFTGGGNSLFFGGANTNDLSSIGAFSGSQNPFIAGYAYHSSTANTLASSGNTAPTVIKFNSGGALQFLGGPANNGPEVDLTLTQLGEFWAAGGFTVGTNTTSPGALNLLVDGTAHIVGGLTNDAASTLTGKVAVGSPSLTDATMSIGATNFLGLNAPLRVTGNGNNVFVGHGNTAYLSSIGAASGGGEFNIVAYGYQTNSSSQAYSGGVNLPYREKFWLTGALSFDNAALGTTGNAISWVQRAYFSPAGGLRLDTSQVEPGAGAIIAPGGITSSTVALTGGLTVTAGANKKLSSTPETLSAGTVVVNNTSITANSKVFLQPTTVSPVSGVLAVTSKSVGASFTVTSSNNQDTNQFSWFIVEAQ